MSAVNYQVTPQSTSVVPGQTVAQSIDPSGGFYTLSSVITPINPSTHTVQASFFTIAGSSGVDDFMPTTGLGVRTYEDISILPESVIKVTFNDTATNEVTLKVSLLPSFVIPANATNPFQIILDIDGDAQEIQQTPQTPDGNPGIFRLSIDLSNSVPNAKIFCVIPPSIGAFNLQNTSAWNIGAEITQTDFTKSTALFIPNSQTTEQSPILGPGAVVQASQPTSCAWFWIVPDSGYTVSKYNFSISSTSQGTQFNPGPAISLPFSGNTTLSNFSANSSVNLNYNPGSIIQAETNLIGDLQPGSYSFVGFNNNSVTLTPPAIPPSTVTSSVIVNYNELVQGTTVSSYSSFAQILLVDTISFSDSYPANFIPTSSQLSTLQSAQAPEGYATSDWTNNAVLVILNGFHNYVPGANSPDLDIQISGSAMLADNNQSEEFNFSIQDIST